MRALLCAALLATLAVCVAHAEVVGTIEAPTGRIDIHDERGACVGQALRAEYVPLRGEPIPGCWLPGNAVLRFVFLDGDVVVAPVQSIRAPRRL